MAANTMLEEAKTVFSNSGMSLNAVGSTNESGGGFGSTVDGSEEL
jgi:hypothetical protein